MLTSQALLALFSVAATAINALEIVTYDSETIGTQEEFPRSSIPASLYPGANVDLSLPGYPFPPRPPRTGCQRRWPATCHNTTVEHDQCCFEAPQGLIEHVQFWDTDPPTGPGNSWTIHGLWPNACNGSYTEYCDNNREYKNLTGIIQAAGQTTLLDYMNYYWISDDESNEKFWEHEWAAHGTCYSTLNPKCLHKGSPNGTEAVLFFRSVVDVFLKFDTYKFLGRAGIEPTTKRNFTQSEFVGAIKKQSKILPAIYCDGSSIYEIYYYFNLIGSAIDGILLGVDAPVPGNCPETGLQYTPKLYNSTNPAPPPFRL